jgi:exopolyphosphatase / guanosine-5'-triphosphate,3'-diphosphate pyrophosphatase
VSIYIFGCSTGPSTNSKNTSHQPTPAKGCAENHAALDIGSGSTKILTASVDICLQKIIKIYWQESQSIKIKESLKTNKNKIPESILTEAVFVIEKWKLKNKNSNIKSYAAVATEVFRQANNGAEFINKLSETTGIPIRIIDQTEEAQLGFWSAMTSSQKSAEDILVWDIGGGSQQMTTYSPKDGFRYYKAKLASVSFKDLIVKLKNKKNAASPNPMGIKLSLQAAKEAQLYAKKDIPLDFKNQIKDKQIIGIGGVHGKSILNQTSNPYSVLDLQDILLSKSQLSDTEIKSEYPETEITNVALVLGFMKYLEIKKVEVVNVDLTLGLILSSLRNKHISGTK